jgi:HPt (histidine-containing phosphotransfer) domain-containing protein
MRELQSFSVLDINTLADMYGDSSATTLIAVLTAFYIEAAKYVVQLQTAVKAVDISAIIGLSHSLKSMCGLIGAQQFAHFCLMLEQAGRDADYQRMAFLSAQFQPCWQALQNAITLNLQAFGNPDD